MRLGRLDVGFQGARVVLAGRLDEGCALASLVDRMPVGDLVIDTAGVTFVNSVGMREWMRLVRALRDRGPVVLERVAEVLIAQMNMIADSARGVRVMSFYAPYACAACGAEAGALVDATAHAQALRQLEAPRLPCAECGAAMELADFPERYLSIFRP